MSKEAPDIGRPDPSKVRALIALGLSLLPLVVTWIASIVLAILVLVRSRDGRDYGKGMAVTALVISIFSVTITAAAVVALVKITPDRDSSGRLTDGGLTSILLIKQGDCISSGTRDLLVKVVPCEDPHFYEAFAVFELPHPWYPGDEEVDRYSDERCTYLFRDFVEIDYTESGLLLEYLTPVEDSWDTNVVCLATTGGKATGSLEGSRL